MTKTAFVFAGGVRLASAQVGILLALEANGIKPELIAGSAIGAINGAYYAGAPRAEGIEPLRQIWIGLGGRLSPQTYRSRASRISRRIISPFPRHNAMT
jgi:NTE family protein